MDVGSELWLVSLERRAEEDEWEEEKLAFGQDGPVTS